ncbi:hypothetical protein [Thermosulfuriphilus sp.]
MEGTLTIFLSPHRPEFLPFIESLLDGKDLVILEEPSNPALKDYFGDRLDLEALVEDLEAGFPVYTKRLSQTLKGIWQRGTKICQIEPYFEGLFEIQSLIEEGLSPQEILVLAPKLKDIYETEHQATEALLNFYAVLGGNFETMVSRVKEFARTDALRIRLRDRLRARAISALLKVCRPKAVFVEAGYIHGCLSYFLASQIRDLKYRLYSENLLLKGTRSLKQIYPKIPDSFLPAPGDGLTASYLFGTNSEKRDLLAARSLVYIKLIAKEELLPSNDNPFPHLLDETRWKMFVSRLSYRQCAQLMARIRFLGTLEAREIALKEAQRLDIKVDDLPPLL